MQTRSFCYVDDLVDGLIRLIESNYRRPVNLGNPEEYNMLAFAKIVKERIDSKSSIVFKRLPEDDPKKMSRYILSQRNFVLGNLK